MSSFMKKLNNKLPLLLLAVLFSGLITVCTLFTSGTWAYWNVEETGKTDAIILGGYQYQILSVVANPLPSNAAVDPYSDGAAEEESLVEKDVTYDTETNSFRVQPGYSYTIFVQNEGTTRDAYIILYFEDIPALYAMLPQSGTGTVTFHIDSDIQSSFTVYIQDGWGTPPENLTKLNTYAVLDTPVTPEPTETPDTEETSDYNADNVIEDLTEDSDQTVEEYIVPEDNPESEISPVVTASPEETEDSEQTEDPEQTEDAEQSEEPEETEDTDSAETPEESIDNPEESTETTDPAPAQTEAQDNPESDTETLDS